MYTQFVLSTIFCCLAGTLTAQCWPEGFTHDTRPETMWLSCETSPSPNPERAAGLWLRFDFGHIYNLSTTTIWNYNEPGSVELGVRRLAVDYSQDGINWFEWGEMDLDLATGQTDYEGQDGPNLSGISARYLLLTAVESGAGTGCAGLAEVRFNLDQSVSVNEIAAANLFDVYPNPTTGLVNFSLPEIGLTELAVYDQQGRLLRQQALSGTYGRLELNGLPSGVYLLVAKDENGQMHRRRITLL